jgi:hypothetical protein
MPLNAPHGRALVAALALLIGSALPTAARAEWREIPYDDVAKMALGLQAVDAQHVFSLHYVFIPGEGQTTLPADLQLQLKNGSTLTPLPVQPSGEVAIPLRRELVGHNLQLRVNQPKARTALQFRVGARLPPSKNVSYAQLTESIPVMERGIEQMAGMMRFMAPKPRALLIQFAPGPAQTLQLSLPDGSKQTMTSDAHSVLHVPWNRDWLRATTVLSAMPVEMGIELK